MMFAVYIVISTNRSLAASSLRKAVPIALTLYP
jgi:hypothetical protein